jgi:hypothetical protein
MTEPVRGPSGKSLQAAADRGAATRSARRQRFFVPLTGAWILGLDWLLFSQNILTVGLATPVLMTVGFLLGGLGTLFLQRGIARDRWSAATLKALLAGLVVGAPWPVLGTVVGGWVLLASGLASRADRSRLTP